MQMLKWKINITSNFFIWFVRQGINNQIFPKPTPSNRWHLIRSIVFANTPRRVVLFVERNPSGPSPWDEEERGGICTWKRSLKLCRGRGEGRGWKNRLAEVEEQGLVSYDNGGHRQVMSGWRKREGKDGTQGRNRPPQIDGRGREVADIECRWNEGWNEAAIGRRAKNSLMCATIED